MKKGTAWVIVCTFLVAVFFWHPLNVKAKEDEERFNLWANDLGRQPGDPNYLTLHYRIREAYFSLEPHKDHATIFLGDSITYGGDWASLFPGARVENSGIGGDTTMGLLNRLDQVIAQKPARIFLMIGTNDLCFGRPIPNIIINYSRILGRLHKELPDTQVFVQSVLPFNDTLFPSRSLRTNANIRQLNVQLRRLAGEYHDPYIDLAPAFTGDDGRLPVRYTSDGLHLSDTGYNVWRDQIRDLVSRPTNNEG